MSEEELWLHLETEMGKNQLLAKINKAVETLEEQERHIKEANAEIERLHSVIKEVREYIEENQEEHKYTDRGGFTYTEGHFLRDSDTLLEILDKEKV